MSAERLASILGALPFVRVRWRGQDANTLTALCEVTPAQELGWAALGEQWLRNVHHGRILFAKQLILMHGQKAWLWNVSVWSSQPEQTLAMMQALVQQATGQGQPGQMQGQMPPGISMSQQHFINQRQGQSSKIEEMPEFQHAQLGVMKTRKRDAITPEQIIASKKRKEVVEFRAPLPGARPNRNIPQGTVLGADGREVASSKGVRPFMG